MPYPELEGVTHSEQSARRYVNAEILGSGINISQRTLGRRLAEVDIRCRKAIQKAITKSQCDQKTSTICNGLG